MDIEKLLFRMQIRLESIRENKREAPYELGFLDGVETTHEFIRNTIIVLEQADELEGETDLPPEIEALMARGEECE